MLTYRCVVAVFRLRLGQGQYHLKSGPFFFTAGYGHVTAEFFDDHKRDAEAQPCALAGLLGCKKWIEYT
jgi:hypothetical protein